MTTIIVAPYTGAWIEIQYEALKYVAENVAPYTGAWIEIFGLLVLCQQVGVAPYTGAWIEMEIPPSILNGACSRTLHGCVD